MMKLRSIKIRPLLLVFNFSLLIPFCVHDLYLCSSSLGTLWRRQWHPTPVLSPGKSYGWRSLVGCSKGLLRVGHNWATSLSRIRGGNGNPLWCSCLENPRDRGAWWAAVYGVAQSRTWLKRLSSSSSSSRHFVPPLCTELRPSLFSHRRAVWLFSPLPVLPHHVPFTPATTTGWSLSRSPGSRRSKSSLLSSSPTSQPPLDCCPPLWLKCPSLLSQFLPFFRESVFSPCLALNSVLPGVHPRPLFSHLQCVPWVT